MNEAAEPTRLTLLTLAGTVALFLPLATYTFFAWALPERLKDLFRTMARRQVAAWEFDDEWLWTMRIASTALCVVYLVVAVWWIVRAAGGG